MVATMVVVSISMYFRRMLPRVMSCRTAGWSRRAGRYRDRAFDPLGMRMFVGIIEQGDKGFIINLYDIPTREFTADCLCMNKITLGHYQIVEQNGKYGLACNQKLLSMPFSTSLELINDDLPLPPYELLDHYENDPSVEELCEWHCAIVNVDGKFGIIKQDRILSELKYDRVIKLTFMHFLCKENAVWTLFYYHGWLHPCATISVQGELTLELLLRELKEKYPKVSKDLSEYLLQDPQQGDYISEYRRYTGSQSIDHNHYHYFLISSDKVILHDDFGITYLRTDRV